MKKILFITFYDVGAMGIRLLSSLAKAKGVQTHFIFFKDGKLEKPVWYAREGKTYTFFDDGRLHSSTLRADPPTAKELQLFIQQAQQIAPQLICLSTRSFGLALSQKMMFDLRTKMPGVPIIAGGWGPTTEPEKFLEFADYVCLGEGERAFCDIVDSLVQGEDFRQIRNLSWLDSRKQIVQNALYPPLTKHEMDALPHPDYDPENKTYITADKCLDGHTYDQVSNYVCMATRGCPMRCSYCQSGQYKQIYSHYGYHCPKMRTRSVDVVISELFAAKRRGAHTITMRDEVFAYERKWVEKFIYEYNRLIKLPFFAYVRPEFHDRDTIVKLRQSGLYLTRIGIQSGSNYTLRQLYQRGLKKDKAVEFAQLLETLGVEYSYHMLNNNPLEQIDHLKETFAFCCQLPHKAMRVFRLVVFPKSRLERMIKENKKAVLPNAIFDWYSILYCMATKGPRFRKIAILIHSSRFCRRFPYPLQLFFMITALPIYGRLTAAVNGFTRRFLSRLSRNGNAAAQ